MNNICQNIDINISKSYSLSFLSKLENSSPFFHTNSLGIEFHENPDRKVLLPELSVTKLATVVECPRKFYFQNICKFSVDELDLLKLPEKTISVEVNEDELSSQNILKSSASRGTEIHETISKLIIDDFEHVNDLKSGRDEKNILWVVDKLKKYMDNSDLISEKPIKFELFGYMISGIPDLIVMPVDESSPCEVWDFKTGAFAESKLDPYYFQLYTYAYSQFILKKLGRDKLIKLIICFVDEQKLVEQEVSYVDVEKYLSKELFKLSTPEDVNTEKCEYCPYTVICKK